jgi:DNA-binding transcriptional LysR family regulator
MTTVMSFEQVRYFVAVAEERHVGRAARRLRIAQPAVSRQIRNLETELGTSLFQRTPRGMFLSDSGTQFLAHARAILELVDHARSTVQRGRETPESGS